MVILKTKAPPAVSQQTTHNSGFAEGFYPIHVLILPANLLSGVLFFQKLLYF